MEYDRQDVTFPREVSSKHPLLCIVGPTGSRKSELALAAAERWNGEIISCDSLQLYRGFTIGTAKLTIAKRASVPHHLIDVLDPTEVCSAGEYSRLARAAIADVSGRGRLPIVAGGAGFYLRALLEGLPPLPDRDERLRRSLFEREQRHQGSLYRILQRLDPAAAGRIHEHDVQKLIRALEVRLLTRRTAPDPSAAAPLEAYRVLKLGLDPPREELCRHLDERAQAMFDRGLIDEVAHLIRGGLTGDEKPFESLGYKEAVGVLRGRMTRDQAVAATQLETRHYAKRQLTWFRRDPEIYWIRAFGGSDVAMQECAQKFQDFFAVS